MRPATLLACLLLLAPMQAYAHAPADFQGSWVVKRVVGVSDVVPSTNPRTLLGTKLQWTDAAVTSAEGTCAFDHAAVAPISNEQLQKFLWGGQTIAGLELPKRETNSVFGRKETEVYYDGGKGCVEAVMLSANRVLFMFRNGYIYLLERESR